MSDNTQLTPAAGYDTSRMTFSNPVVGSIPDTTITFKRINIGTINEDGTRGELIIPTERLFSFGVSENADPKTKEVNGWTLPLALHSKDGATESEKIWVDTFNAVVERAIDHCMDNGDKFDKFDLDRSEFKKFNPLYHKMVKTEDPKTGRTILKPDDRFGPTLYAKLIYSKKKEKFVTQFYNKSDGKSLNPLDLMGKYCYVRGAVKIESIFIGAKCSLQVKLYECEIEPSSSGTRRLLAPSGPSLRDMEEAEEDDDDVSDLPRMDLSSSKPMVVSGDGDGGGSIAGSDEDEPAPSPSPAPVIKKRVVKKVVRKASE